MKPKYIAIIVLAILAGVVGYIAVKSSDIVSNLFLANNNKTIDVSKEKYQSICDLKNYNIKKRLTTNFYGENEIPDEIKRLTTNIVKNLSGYKKFVKKYPGSFESIENMTVYPFTYISRPGETTPLIPNNIVKDAKLDSIIVRYSVTPPGIWIPEEMPSYDAYVDICHLKVY